MILQGWCHYKRRKGQRSVSLPVEKVAVRRQLSTNHHRGLPETTLVASWISWFQSCDIMKSLVTQCMAFCYSSLRQASRGDNLAMWTPLGQPVHNLPLY